MGERHPAVIAATLAVTLGLSGCQGIAVTRAGIPPAPTVLHIATADAAGRFTDEAIEAFAERVTHESAGTIEIETDRLADDQSRWNQETAQRVIDGADELGIVPAPAWDAFGVSTFSALYVPYAVTTDELIDAVAEDPLATEMLAGIEPLGLTGLALVPGGVRHTFRSRTPFETVESYAGAGVRVPYSEAIWQYYTAIGAVPMDPNGNAGQPLIDSGELTGFDAMYRFADSMLDFPATAADTAAYPHALTLVANDAALEALSPAQRDALDRAAAATVSWSIETRPSDAEQARRLCERAPGAVVSAVGDDVLAELREASRPVAAALLSDPIVAGFAARIAVLDAELGHPHPAVVPCDGPVLETPPPPPPNEPAAFPEGEYRRLVTAAELTAAGLDESTAEEHKGLWILNARGGVLHGYGCPGTRYEVIDGRFTVFMGEKGEECGTAADKILFSAGWQLVGDELTFTAVQSGAGSELLLRTLFGGGPWTKVQ